MPAWLPGTSEVVLKTSFEVAPGTPGVDIDSSGKEEVPEPSDLDEAFQVETDHQLVRNVPAVSFR